MRIKLILVVALGALVAYWWTNKPSIESLKTKDTHTIEEEKVKKDVIVKEQNLDKKQSKDSVAPTEEVPETAMTVLKDVTYSTDPVVNTYTIFKNNQLCYSQLEKNNSKSIYMQQFLERVEDKQAEYFEKFIQHCKQLNEQHPEYSLTDKDHILSQMKNAKPNSLWGKIISKEIDVDSLSNNEITQLLKSNDINILQEAPSYFKTHYQEVVHWDLESVLGNHDYDYVNYIQQYAHQLYLCDLGAPCDANSTIMASLCFRDATSCGLDFNSYINNSLTPGQQADIQLAQSYLRSQYQ